MNTVSPVLQGALQLGVAVHVDHVVPDARVLVARDQAHRLAAALHQEDGASIEAEGLAQSACHGLHDVHEVQGAGDFLEDLDHGEQVPALVFELLDPLLEPLELLPLALSDRRGHARVRWLKMCQT